VVAVAGRLVAATQALWGRIAPKMLPTPAKFHYLFNMRDISKAHSWDSMALLVAEHVHRVAAAKYPILRGCYMCNTAFVGWPQPLATTVLLWPLICSAVPGRIL